MARPALEIVATDVVAEAQVTWLVRFCVELSEYVPVAVNCWVVALGRGWGSPASPRSIPVSAAVTVSTVEPLITARRSR